MHESSFEKMRQFVQHYLFLEQNEVHVLDVGAASIQSGVAPYRALFTDQRFHYVGLDFRNDENVDIVPFDPFHWPIADETFDAVISGQCFEHDPFFWLTTAQMARVLKPGGFLCVIAPSGGMVHAFPLDCWRFYPDSGPALCAYVGLELLEAFVETPTADRNYRVRCGHNHAHDYQCNITGLEWMDMMFIARKPVLAEADRARYYERLNTILAVDVTFPPPPPHGILKMVGPAIAAYEDQFPSKDPEQSGVFGWSYFDR